MRMTLLMFLLGGAFAASASAQQGNSTAATMLFNNQSGPTVPINPVNCPRGHVVQAVVQSGLPGMPFLVGHSRTLLAQGVPLGPNLVDISSVGIALLFDGFGNQAFNTGSAGQWSAQFIFPLTELPGAASCWQSAIADPASVVGVTLTAATRTVITASGTTGITVQPLSLGDDQSVNISLASFGITLPFYAQTYNNINVHSNGEINFGSGSTDFTATSSEFLAQMPRISGEWTDLAPNTGGTITAFINQGTTPPNVCVEFVNVPEFGFGAIHSFSIRIWAAPVGDVEISSASSTSMGFYDLLVGISAGSGLGPQNAANPMKDLSAMNNNPILGAANENFHEWFGLLNGSMPYYQPTPYVARPFDLMGTTQIFFGIGAGALGAHYWAISVP